MSFNLWFAALLLLFLLSYVLYQSLGSKKSSKLSLPPGPKPLPLVGNIRDLPKPGQPEWLHWLEHKKVYGPISSITVLANTIVILNSAKLALELLEKKSISTSARPRMVFAAEMCGWDNLMVFTPSQDMFRATRRQFHTTMGTPTALARFLPAQETEVERFLLRILATPAELLQHIRTEAGAIALKIGYDYTVEPDGHDPLIRDAEKTMDEFSQAAVAGAWLVDTIPALKNVPEWIPGASFKATARSFKKSLTHLAEEPLRFAKHQMTKPNHSPSFVSSIFEKSNNKLSAEEEGQVMWSAASLYTGGADTTVGMIQSFFLAMSVYPEVQKRAWEEIDRVVGTGRLPNFSDRNKLPFVDAVVSEAFRWHTIAPMGIPHVAVTDETCGGYSIPKGAMILANLWSFLHDPEVYDEPEVFKPERFQGLTPQPDPRLYAFGFGRRVCPGRLLADSSVWLTLAKTLAVFAIGKGLDGEGNEIEPQVLFQSGTISHPEPFKCHIRPRSAEHERLIKAAENWDKGDAEELESLRIASG